jgi:hypothetical protein
VQVSSTFLNRSVTAVQPVNGATNPFSLEEQQDGTDGAGFAELQNRSKADRRSTAPRQEVANTQDRNQQAQLKELSEMLQSQQQEMQRLQQSQYNFQSGGQADPLARQMGLDNPQDLSSALNQKATEVNDLQSKTTRLSTGGQIGGFVGQPLQSGQKINVLA